MPYQIKNGIIYSGNAVTLTQAQYDALTTAEKNNGTVYYIYDSDAMIEAQEVGLDGGNVEDLAGSVATFETSPSTAVHAEGEYILYQAQLYKVTSAIAVGEDLTVGSNIEATNLGNELNNGLTSKNWQSVGVIAGTGQSIQLPTGWKEIGVGMTLKHSLGGYGFYTMSKLALELSNASKLVFGGYNFGCVLAYNSTAQTLTYDNYYSATVDLYFRVYVRM